MNEGYIQFEGMIDQQASQRLFAAFDQMYAAGVQKIILFFSSLGGNIYEGFILASLIQNSKVPIAIHATNHIDSIGNVIYMSASERTSESYAKFYLHGASVNGNFDEKALREKLSEIKTQNGRIAAFITENSSLSLARVGKIMEVGTTLSAQQALKSKIVQKIEHKVIPANVLRTDIIYIN